MMHLPCSSTHFRTHFIYLNDQSMLKSTNEKFDGHLLCLFIINQMVQTRLKNGEQQQCIDATSIYLDKLHLSLTIQQYSNKCFVLF